jgi:hypothetical protein
MRRGTSHVSSRREVTFTRWRSVIVSLRILGHCRAPFIPFLSLHSYNRRLRPCALCALLMYAKRLLSGHPSSLSTGMNGRGLGHHIFCCVSLVWLLFMGSSVVRISKVITYMRNLNARPQFQAMSSNRHIPDRHSRTSNSRLAHVMEIKHVTG